MRVKYLLSILYEAVTSLPDFKFDIAEEKRAFILQIVEKALGPGNVGGSKGDLQFLGLLAAYDAIQPPSTWVSSWTELILFLVLYYCFQPFSCFVLILVWCLVCLVCRFVGFLKHGVGIPVYHSVH